MILTSTTLASDRIKECEKCPHFRKRTRTCGTPLVGNKVGSKRTCGCFMDVKTKLKFAKCPLNKWEGLQITHDEYLEVKGLLDATQHQISNIQQQQMRLYMEKYLGVRVGSSSCAPCVKNNLISLRQIIEQYEK
tara:strand:- start:5599 stop:6000 length:402 start_codon:yes stop_codon:yes gene_type:complete